MTNPDSFATSILHPTDLSSLSERAFMHALALALKAHAKFVMCHVSADKLATADWATFPGVRAALERWGLLEAGSKTSDVAARAGIEVVKLNVWNRSPLGPLIDTVNQRNVDFLVLATHGREGLPRWLNPSIAEPLARNAKVATLFVSDTSKGFVAEDSGELALRRILVPVDFNPHPSAALNGAAQIVDLVADTDAEPAEITLLHVGEAAMPDFVPPATPHVRWLIAQKQGEVVTTILAAAAEIGADLIVMATQGHQGFLDALRGSTTERVLRNAPCPLLAVPVIA